MRKSFNIHVFIVNIDVVTWFYSIYIYYICLYTLTLMHIVFRIYYKIQVSPRKMTGFFLLFFFSNIERVTVSQSRRLIIGRPPINEDIVDKRISLYPCT